MKTIEYIRIIGVLRNRMVSCWLLLADTMNARVLKIDGSKASLDSLAKNDFKWGLGLNGNLSRQITPPSIVFQLAASATGGQKSELQNFFCFD